VCCGTALPFFSLVDKKGKAVPLHAMEALVGRGGIELLLIHDLGTRWGWVVSVTPRPRFTPAERTPVPIVQEAGLDTEATGKILCPCQGLNLDRPVVHPVVRHYTAWANPAPNLVDTGRYFSGVCWHVGIFLPVYTTLSSSSSITRLQMKIPSGRNNLTDLGVNDRKY
jgi:hypothetical protein